MNAEIGRLRHQVNELELENEQLKEYVRVLIEDRKSETNGPVKMWVEQQEVRNLIIDLNARLSTKVEWSNDPLVMASFAIREKKRQAEQSMRDVLTMCGFESFDEAMEKTKEGECHKQGGES